jgi:hypothetical protein
MQFKLGFGPMSLMVNEILAKYAKDNKQPLMIIASRNQIDSNSGYVMTTTELSNQLNPLRSDFLMLCRDHCGPYFLDVEKSLSLRDAIEATKKTIAGDIENNFDLIHIDTSRCDNQYRIADELFEFCFKLNPNIKFEFGTEENVGVGASVEKYKVDVKFAKQYPNMQFVVAQTGSLVMENRQSGSFDMSLVNKLVSYANDAGIKLKEHNADYLTKEQINLRKQAGVHACNIAPQLGLIQTQCILRLADKFNIDTTDFKNKVLDSEKWKKWIIDGGDNVKVSIAGHYCFNDSIYNKLEDKLSQKTNVFEEVKNEITKCLDLYYNNLY